jgi:sugar porter (SP) family MFS transporter
MQRHLQLLLMLAPVTKESKDNRKTNESCLMRAETVFTIRTALIVALGGFLMGFDASVISGVVRFIKVEFALNGLQLGWVVACLSLSASLAMLAAGPLSNQFGRRAVLKWAAACYVVSALGSALATGYASLIAFRMLGGIGVGAALILAPMYIAEIAPPAQRGRLVSINQLNIVIGITVAFFTNYLILQLAKSEAGWSQMLNFGVWQWRWMLGVEVLPAVLYLIGLQFVPESPRWLMLRKREAEALEVMTRACGATQAALDIDVVRASLNSDKTGEAIGEPMLAAIPLKKLLHPSLRGVMIIGLVVAVLQQITGINAIFFYAPMIFEQTGIGADAAFLQAVLVGLTNLVFTVVAMLLIDRLGRRPLLLMGVSGITVCMFLLAYGFGSATYTLASGDINTYRLTAPELPQLVGQTFESEAAFRDAATQAAGPAWYAQHGADLEKAAIELDAGLILFAILGFVASFAMSLGPVMWVLFSELFPNHVRALAISVAGLANSLMSFLVQLIFPTELAILGAAITFALFGMFALLGLGLIAWLLPETRGRSLEALEMELVAA